MPFKGNKWDWTKGVSKKEILNRVTDAFGNVNQLDRPQHSTSAEYRVAGFKGRFAIVPTITDPFCADCNRLRLTADGKMKNCLFASQETDLLSAYREGMDIKPIILKAIQTKKYSRDGMSEKIDKGKAESNRTMISIGG